MISGLKHWPWIALLVLLAGCARAEPARPLLWKVSDRDNHLYLLGSFHALKPSDYPLPASIAAALADAEHVTFELPPAELESPELAQDMLAAAKLPAGQSLEQILPAPLWQRLQAYCRDHALPLAHLKSLDPWFVALFVGLEGLARNGYDPQLGLDRDLMARAASAGKATSGLESSADQIRMFDSMSTQEQVETLSESLEGENQIDQLHALWRAGDEQGMYREMAQEFRRKYPALYRRIDTDRNDAWMPKLRAMLDGEHERDTLVVVGSLHLLGDEGLVAKMRAAGYKVERVN